MMLRANRLAATAFAIAMLAAVSQAQADDRFKAPGDLIKDTGVGLSIGAVLYPEMRFPLEDGPAYANSHVYAPGGFKGNGGSQCDTVNYSYPWRDNFCELRRSNLPVCASGGHQGQDIRPASCQADTHWAVAVEDGVIAHVGRFALTLQTPSGTLYRYVHINMDDLAVAPLDKVSKGDRLGKVSNAWISDLPIHLHFDVKDTVKIGDETRSVFVPPYSSLVTSYRQLTD
ncbi:M23 family metallopeptidase [Phaeobacter sp. JH20_36]|uniref:M23 family metallopeptidase n=1 Tax=unclassified Phaeobacter TaxID=2621772 RepID=UPI003A85569D